MKIRQVAMSVAIVIPEIGLEEDPIKPTMRELTVTKKNPKITTMSAVKMLTGTLGNTAINNTKPIAPATT